MMLKTIIYKKNNFLIKLENILNKRKLKQKAATSIVSRIISDVKKMEIRQF